MKIYTQLINGKDELYLEPETDAESLWIEGFAHKDETLTAAIRHDAGFQYPLIIIKKGT